MKHLFLLLLATSISAETYTLRYKPAQGETRHYTYSTNISSSQTMNGNEQTFDIGSKMTLAVKAEATSKDSVTFIARAEKVSIDLRKQYAR